MFVGNRKYLDTIEMKAEYLSLRDNNLAAAKLLESQGLYNEAIYMYIQTMEKEIKGYIMIAAILLIIHIKNSILFFGLIKKIAKECHRGSSDSMLMRKACTV